MKHVTEIHLLRCESSCKQVLMRATLTSLRFPDQVSDPRIQKSPTQLPATTRDLACLPLWTKHPTITHIHPQLYTQTSLSVSCQCSTLRSVKVDENRDGKRSDMDISTPSNADVVEHDQPVAPGKERERDPILGGDLINLSNGGVNSEQREYSSIGGSTTTRVTD